MRVGAVAVHPGQGHAAAAALQALKLFLGLFGPAGGGQLARQHVAQRHQVVRVQAGIVEQLVGERALAPVGALEALVHGHAEALLQDGAQAQPGPAQGAGGHHGVEDVGELEIVVALEADQVVFGGVKNLLLGRVGKQGP